MIFTAVVKNVETDQIFERKYTVSPFRFNESVRQYSFVLHNNTDNNMIRGVISDQLVHNYPGALDHEIHGAMLVDLKRAKLKFISKTELQKV